MDKEGALILERLRRERIPALFHFTSIENLPSISRSKKVCSKDTQCKLGIWPPCDPGGNELSHRLDKDNDNWDKLALNFTPHTPMAYLKKAEKHLCFLVIDIKVAALANVVFTDTNATSTILGHQRATGLEGLELVNFEAIRSRPRPWDKEGWRRPVQAEVLIPDCLPLSDVQAVLFVSQASLKAGERLWGTNDHPPFRVDEGVFSDIPGSSTFSFAFLRECFLTDQEVNTDTVGTALDRKTVFTRASTQKIFSVMRVHALTGTVAETIWNPGNIVSSHMFGTSNDYLHWPSVEIDQLPDGQCQLEYRLGGVRWATIEFQLG